MARPKGSTNSTTKSGARAGARGVSGRAGGASGRTGGASGKAGDARKSAGGRKSSAGAGTKKGTAASARKTAAKKKQEQFMGDEVAVICTFAVAVFLFLSNLGVCGPIGTVMKNAQLGLFGTVGYIFPLVLVGVVAFVVSNKENPYAVLKMTAVLAGLIFLAALLQLTVGGGAAFEGLGAYYKQAASTGIGGGIVGGALSQLLYSLTGQAGAVLILIAALFICLVYVTEKPLARMLAQGSIQVAGRAKEDLDRMAEAAKQHAEERRQYRLEQRARGVDLSATDLFAAMPQGGAAEADGAYPDEDVYAGDSAAPADGSANYGYGAGGAAGADYDDGYGADRAPDMYHDGYGAESAAAVDYDGYRSGSAADAAHGGYAYDDDAAAARQGQEGHTVQRHEGYADENSGAAADRGIFGVPDTPEDDPYSRFTGRILPEDYDYDEDDSVPFDDTDIYLPEELLNEAEARQAADRRAAGGTVPAGMSAASAGSPAAVAAGIAASGRAAAEVEPVSGAAGAVDGQFWQSRQDMGNVAGGDNYDADTRETDGYGVGDRSADIYSHDTSAGAADAYSAENASGAALGLNSVHATNAYRAENSAEQPAGPVPTEADIQAVRARRTDTFGQEAGSRRITTASGRVIESDMDALKKRVEQKREEAQADEDNAAVQAELAKKKAVKPYVFPPLSLLKRGGRQQNRNDEEIRETAVKLQQTLKSFGVGVTVTDVSVGPAVTRYELHPEQGVKVSRIVSLTDDIKLSLAASDIRIEAPIPGKSAVGIEVPNKENVMVYLGDVLGSREFSEADSRLSFGVGKDIGGKTVVTDLKKMPHLLIAGATGSGKSVCINTIIMSLIYKSTPEEVRLIMIDPKVVELQVYNGIPHLLIPVVTDPKKASAALNWAVAEMTDRYKKFAELGVRDLKGYNARVEAVRQDPAVAEEKKPAKLPQIVIIVDELADLMMVAPGEVEDAICRLAQLARAAGIHLVIATQRPSVNVITGLIKANVPSRIAFAVSSGVDSRTIIDMNGAEKLLGKGDMLFYPSGIPKPVRVQGAFVSDGEVQAVVDYLTRDGAAEYSAEIESRMLAPSEDGGSGGAQNDRDALFHEAGAFIIEADKASVSMLQRKFRIGFNRAARIMDQLAEAQVVGPEEGTKPRRILMSMEEFNEI